jgi:hypothetical protein
MPVFISYRHSDRDVASTINTKLKANGIETYFDVLDEESKNTDDITAVITKNISKCTHLLAVMSNQTARSWWVPFEIGEATITARRIASFQTNHTDLPEYLSKWPKMRTEAHLDMFIQSYLHESVNTRNMFESVGNESYNTYSNRDSADRFHENLKKQIHQG